LQRVYILQRVGVSREVTAAVNLHLAGAAARHGAVSEFVEAGRASEQKLVIRTN
jgi:hypothetical protein